MRRLPQKEPISPFRAGNLARKQSRTTWIKRTDKKTKVKSLKVKKRFARDATKSLKTPASIASDASKWCAWNAADTKFAELA